MFEYSEIEMRIAAREKGVPDHMLDGLMRHILIGGKVGGFLTAVFRGELFEALNRADEQNMYALPAYAKFLYNYAPGGCFGTRAQVKQWQDQGGLEGMQAEEDAAGEDADREMGDER